MRQKYEDHPPEKLRWIIADVRADAYMPIWADDFTTREEAESFLKRAFEGLGGIPEYLIVKERR